MEFELGVLLAFVAMFFWGFGDFLIQKSTRKFGDWETLFVITLFGTIVLTPFVYQDISQVFSDSWTTFILAIGAIVLLFAALFEFESLKKGKISVVEPLWSVEIPAASFLAFIILGEKLGWREVVLVVFLIFGLVLVSLRNYHISKKVWLEKAVFLAVFGALMMGAANFFVGWGARVTDALFVNWFVNLVSAFACFSYLSWSGKLKKAFKDMKIRKKHLLAMSIFDNAAWIAFAYSMTLAPIAISVAISESYIIIAVLLGVFVNKEFLRKHQIVGLVLAVAAALILAIVS